MRGKGEVWFSGGMSRIQVQSYLSRIDQLRRVSGSTSEVIVSQAFARLLEDWAQDQKLIFVQQHPYETTQKTVVRPDGAVLHDIRVPLGWWEAKDTADDLDREIEKKLRKGYPQDNIVFENGETAVLYQNRAEVLRCGMTDVAGLEKLVTLFFGYERPEIAEFRAAVRPNPQ